jgi:hypothetical protein
MRLRADRREVRQAEAKVRQAEWSKNTPAQKLKVLDQRLGKGEGAKRERARLAA